MFLEVAWEASILPLYDGRKSVPAETMSALDARAEFVRELCQRSAARLPFADERSVFEEFRELNKSGNLRNSLTGFIQSALCSPDEPRFTNRDIRIVGRSLFLASVIDGLPDRWGAVLRVISACLQNGVPIRPFEDTVWDRAIDVARGLVKTGYSFEAVPGDRAIAKAARKLAERGFVPTVSTGEMYLSQEDMANVTLEIQKNLDAAGQMAVFGVLFQMLRANGQYEGGVYLPARTYSLNEREPSFPLNFLLNLAVRSPAPPHAPADAAVRIQEAFLCAQQLGAVIDVEPYNMFEGLNTEPSDIEAFLRKMAIYDHLFTFRQWPPEHTSFLLREFFGAGLSNVLDEQVGWNIDPVIALYEACAEVATTDPTVVSRNDLDRAGLPRESLEAVLPHFVHSPQSVNANYISPMHASETDFIFKPLIALPDDRYVIPALPIAAYSFFEAAMKPIYERSLVDSGAVSRFVGAGTEKVIDRLLSRAGIQPSFRAARYQSTSDRGECDFVLESDTVIVFVECKSKALTRTAMAGVSGDALIDFAKGLLESQKQAVRHERLLRTGGQLRFLDNSVLPWNKRKILRLSVTLIDLGALQDRLTVFNLYDILRFATVSHEPGYKKSRQIEELNSLLHEFRTETQALEGLGESVRGQMMRTLSLSVGQLAILLEGVTDLGQFLKRMPTHVTTGSRNPLIEYFRLKKSGVVN